MGALGRRLREWRREGRGGSRLAVTRSRHVRNPFEGLAVLGPALDDLDAIEVGDIT